MRRDVFLVAMVAFMFSSPLGLSESGKYIGLYTPHDLMEGDIIILPTESGIDILSLSNLVIVDHIDVEWTDIRDIELGLSNGKVAYIENGIKTYDLKTKEKRLLKAPEGGEIFENLVFSYPWIGYRETKREDNSTKLDIISVEGDKAYEASGEPWDFFVSAWKNFFVIRRSELFEIFDVEEKKVISSHNAKRNQIEYACIDGEWVAYIDSATDWSQPNNIYLWNYRTGEERLILKGAWGKHSGLRAEIASDCILANDTLVWKQCLNSQGERDDAVYMYSIERNETKLVRKEEAETSYALVDFDGGFILFSLFNRNPLRDLSTYVIHDLSTGKEVEMGR